MKRILVGSAIAAGLVAAPVSAATIDLSSGAIKTADGKVNIVGGSAWTISSTAKAGEAVSTSNSSLNASTAYLYQGSAYGWGVSNSTYDKTNYEHTVDNVNGYDFLVINFDQAVQLTKITLNAFRLDGVTTDATKDKDAWVSYSNLATSNSGFLGDILSKKKDAMTDGGNNNPFASFGTTYAKTWVIGAALTPAERNDAFKLAGITFNVQAAVPEPTTWTTMILGFGVIGGALRRRRRSALATA